VKKNVVSAHQTADTVVAQSVFAQIGEGNRSPYVFGPSAVDPQMTDRCAASRLEMNILPTQH